MKKNNLIKSFGFAFNGIFFLLRKERNFKIHITLLILAICSGYFFGISKIEWLAIFIISALVLSLEAINSTIEKLCDLYSTEQNNSIKQIKDIAAGAVLIASLFAIIVGLIIFLPYIVDRINLL